MPLPSDVLTHAAVAVRVDPSSRPRTRYTDFLPPGARIAQPVVFDGDYEDVRRVHSAGPSSACARPDRSVTALRAPPSSSRSRPEPFPNAAEIGREIKFLTVNGGFKPY